MRMRDDMTFPPEEYERRIRELRERMQRRLLRRGRDHGTRRI